MEQAAHECTRDTELGLKYLYESWSHRKHNEIGRWDRITLTSQDLCFVQHRIRMVEKCRFA